MIAYVFVHRPAAGVDPGRYEELLREFQSVLAAEAPVGFLGAACLAVGDAYEDWYLLDGTASLDALEEAAVSGARRQPHDAAARASGEGAGGLYRLAAGPVDLFGVRVVRWEAEEPADVPAGAAVWRRRLALGPRPEWCVHAPGGAGLSARRVWP